jgi:hypothetical protein
MSRLYGNIDYGTGDVKMGGHTKFRACHGWRPSEKVRHGIKLDIMDVVEQRMGTSGRA